MKVGRPSKFTPEIAEEIVQRLSDGEPLAQICRDDHMPGYRTVADWREAFPPFSANIARAREAGFDQIALDALRIADDGSNDTYETENGDKVDTDHIQRSKLRVETRLKLLAKWDPKRYGDKVQHTGPNGDEPAAFVLVGRSESTSDDEWQARNG